jgi:serine/threonine-protein kinase
MATVYLAQDLRHERLVALKVLHPELAATIGSDRFLREIRTVARLQHPHILSVHDSGEAAGLLWFTMPFIEGESLRDRLQREHQLPVDEAVRITHEVARALDYAHRHGVVHRDIKPENILLTSDGDTLVADFGIGRAIGAGLPEERLTETGVVVGTAAYMSPEQAAGEREIDGRSDVYSLGAVLYEMLTGEPPFTGPTTQAIIARRFTESPRPIRPVRATVPEGVEQVVMCALARLPADRPGSAADFAKTLDAARGAKGVAPPTMRSGSRNKWIAGVAGVVLTALSAGILLRSRTDANQKLDTSLLAVAPFDVLDSKLGLWREGMVDLLSRNLDGAGPLRTVSPTVVVRRWRGRADPESAADLGRRTGAGLALYGSLLSSGKDSVRVRATLLDVRRQSPVEEWELVEVADRVDRLGDSLTFRLLRGLGRTRPVGSVRLAGFGSSSLPAVKAFLQGEQHLRRSEWDSALGYYERAIRLDSTFAPALRRASTALGWIRTGTDSLSTALALRAGEHNHRLPVRDSFFVTSDSLFASLLQAGPFMSRADSGWGARLHRLFALLDQITSRYSNDPEAWFLMGEAINHLGPYIGYSSEQQLEAFDRAIALDSAYGPSYIHPLETSANSGALAMRKYLHPYLSQVGEGVKADGPRLVQKLLDLPSGSGDPAAHFKGVSDKGLIDAYLALNRLPDSAELVVSLTRFIAKRPLSIPPFDNAVSAKRALARSLMSRGHLAQAYELLADMELTALYAEAALLGAAPAESVRASFRERLSAPLTPMTVLAFPWWAAQRDSASLRTAYTRADSAARWGTGATTRQVARYATASAKAHLALAQGDTTHSIEQFQALPRDLCPACYLDRLILAQLLVDRGRDRAAWEILRGDHPSSTLAAFATEVLWVLLRGRVAERIGERERAVKAYAWVTGMWRNADPELQPYVKEAREGLARLTSERK